MSISLVQSFYGANSTSGGSMTTPFTVTPSTGIGSATAGHCIVVVSAYTITRIGSGTIQTPTVVPSVTGDGGGGNWRTPQANHFPVSSVTSCQGFAISYLQNCPSVSSGTVSVQFSFGGSGITENATACEFAVYEFSGVATNANPSLIVDTSRTSAFSSGTPATANLPTTQTDLILAVYSGNSANISAGTGYNLGINMPNAVFCQTQYILNQASGSIATAFNGTETNYVASAVALLPGAGGGFSGTSVNYGYWFG